MIQFVRDDGAYEVKAISVDVCSAGSLLYELLANTLSARMVLYEFLAKKCSALMVLHGFLA